jgi:hypothetical protein
LSEQAREQAKTHPHPAPGNPWRDKIKHLTGLDRAILFSVFARVFQIVGSTGTVLLIVRYLTPIEQGYYYTLYSLVALQVVFELGFSFVILQMAAHERAYLNFLPDGSIQGDPIAHKRLASVLQKVRRWYSWAAVLMFVTLAPAGWYFFLRHQQPGDSVHWELPWALLVFIASLMFQIDPVFSFLEGCGQVAQVARLRMGQTVLGVALGWAALISGHGLFSPAVTLIGQFSIGLIFLWPRRKLLLSLLRCHAGEHSIGWASEVWPFQWKIAVSWLCSYFTAQIFTPILFTFCGAVVAGQMGMSMSIVGSLGAVALPWISTKSAPFGTMVQKQQKKLLDKIFFRTLFQSTVLVGVGAVVLIAALIALGFFYPRLTARMVPVPLFAVLAVTAICAHIVRGEALFLRAHKCEPFLIQSVALAVLVTGSALVLARAYGAAGIAWSYFVCMGALALISGTIIFWRKRRQWGYTR